MSDPVGGFLQGLLQGAEGGYAFRTGIQDRKRRLATEAENATYERARRLREDVAFQLQQRVGQGQLAAQERTTQTETDRRARVTAAAQQIRQQYGADPRYKGITLLPDEELVQEFGDLLAHPERLLAEQRRTQDLQRQDLGTVERQVDDTRADLSRAEREQPQRPLFFATPSDSTAFAADSASAAGRVGALRERADSLSAVRDSIAARIQGRSYHRPSVGNKTPADRWEELVAQGVPPAEATRRVKAEFRLP